MTDNTQSQSSEEKVYDKMPELDEFRTLDSEKQKELIAKFPQDQDEEKSETSETESESDQPKEDAKEAKSKKDDQPEEAKKEEEPDLVKRYRELQAEFTRRSQRLSKLESEFNELKAKVTNGKETEEKSPLDRLVEDNPKAKELIDALRADVEQRLDKGIRQGIQPIQETLTQRQAVENFSKFQGEVKKFLDSPLGKMEAEFNEVAAGLFENQDALETAASKDPALFEKLQEKVLAKHFVKAAKLMNGIASPEEKNKIVKDTGVAGKSKTTTEVDDELDLKVFNKLSSDEMKKVLSKHGAVKNS